MKKLIFTVYDSAASAYLQPFFMDTKALALRAFTALLVDDKHPFSQHPSDYTLFLIGEYDEETGTLTNYEIKTSLGSALEHKSALNSKANIPSLNA